MAVGLIALVFFATLALVHYVSALCLVAGIFLKGVLIFFCLAGTTLIREVKEEIGQDVESLEYISSYPYDKKEMLMLGFKASVKKKDLVLSKEVNSAEWVPLEKAPSLLREGGIAWQLVRRILNAETD